MLLLLLLSCSTPPIDTAERSFEFADKWLQLDNFYQDTCFYLSTIEKNVIIYDRGNDEVEEKDWLWEFYPPDLFVIDEHDLLVIKSEQCYYLEAYNITSTACECNMEIP